MIRSIARRIVKGDTRFYSPPEVKSRGMIGKAALTSALVAGAALFVASKVKGAGDPMAATGTTMRAARDMQSVLDALAAMDPAPIETLHPAEARRQPTIADAVTAVLWEEGSDAAPSDRVRGVTSADRVIRGPTSSLPVRIFTPDGGGPFPVVVYFHGGGWVLADRSVYDSGARGLAKAANAIVISVDYRRAPEAPFPAAWDDAFAAYQWTVENATTINGDRHRIALAGESAGGNLAVSTAIAVRNAGLTPPRHIVAVYPVAQTGDLDTESYVDSATAKPLSKAMIDWFFQHAFETARERADRRVDLVNADLAGLPPVTIINARIDPLRTDGELLEAALRKAGVPVERRVYRGATHEFFGTAPVVGDAADAQSFAGKALQRAFA